MSDAAWRGSKEGVVFGLIAGIFLLLAETAGALLMGEEAILPLRYVASVVLGPPALASVEAGTILLYGGVTHAVLSSAFGLLYGFVNGWFKAPTRTNLASQAALGALFGAVLWGFNIQLVARLYYPWFLEMRQFIEMVLHALCFGLPLATLYAAAERRLEPAWA